MDFRKVKAEFYIEFTTAEPFLSLEMYECELPPEGRIITYRQKSYTIQEIRLNYDNGTARIIVD